MNIKNIRKETPACQDVLFFNSAGASLMPNCVVKKIKDYLDEETQIGGYQLAEQKEIEIQSFYDETAKLLNTQPINIAFAYNATDAYTKALSTIDFKPLDVIITSDDDYVSNFINFISLKKRVGVNIIRMQNLDNGDIDVEKFEALVRKHRPKLVSLSHIPTNSGKIQNAAAVGEICKRTETLFLLDACQSVGQIQVDVQKLNCDFLSATGRKFLRGPRGTGFLYVSNRVLEKGLAPLNLELVGAHWTGPEDYELEKTAKRFEFWELPYASLLGLKEAISYANVLGMDNIETRNQELMSHLKGKLQSIPTVQLYDDGSKTGNILTFRKDGHSLESLKAHLTQHKILYSTLGRSSALLDFNKKGIDWAIRLSPHYFNTMEELDLLAEKIESI